MVNVTKENFIEASNDLLQHLPTAAFVAIDEEMTGINIDNRRPRKDETPADRYPALKKVPELYSIIQLGICLFHHRTPPAVPAADDETAENENDKTSNNKKQKQKSKPPKIDKYDNKQWIIRKYNFYMFPAAASGGGTSRDVVLNPGAVAFLHQHNMSFDVWSKSGVPYLSKDDARNALRTFLEKQQEVSLQQQQQEQQQLQQQQQAYSHLNNNNIQSPSYNTNNNRQQSTPTTHHSSNLIQLTRTEDMEFFARTMASLREWLDAAHVAASAAQADTTADSDELDYNNDPRHSLVLPPCNSFLRRALYQSIGKEYPDLILEKAENAPGGNHYHQRIRVLRLNPDEQRDRQERMRQKQWNDFLVQTMGMVRVWEALWRVCSGRTLSKQHVLFAQSAKDVNFTLTPEEDEKDYFNGLQNGKRSIPIVVHNGCMDLWFLLTHFHAPRLPDTLVDCKQLLHNYFPIIYDTKVLLTECCASSLANEQSHLSHLFQMVAVKEDPPYNYYYNTQNKNNATDAAAVAVAGGIPDNNTNGVEPPLVAQIYDCDVPSAPEEEEEEDDEPPEPEEPEDGEIVEDEDVNEASVGAGDEATTAETDPLPQPAAVAVLDDQEHEAAYDAYMTGAVFIGLCRHIVGWNNMEHFRRYGQDLWQSLSERNNTEAATSAAAETTITTTATRPSLFLDKLLVRLLAENDSSCRSRFGRNKLFQMVSIYTMDVEEGTTTITLADTMAAAAAAPGGDPLKRGMLPEATFRVMYIDEKVTTRDIVESLREKCDSSGRPVHFDIIWVDDTTFMVSVKFRPDDDNVEVFGGYPEEDALDLDGAEPTFLETQILQEHGRIIYNALRQRFVKETIMTLKEYFEDEEALRLSTSNGGNGEKEEEAGVVASNDTNEDEDETKAAITAAAAVVQDKLRGWMTWVLDLFGLERKRASGPSNGGSSSPSSKRRRVE